VTVGIVTEVGAGEELLTGWCVYGVVSAPTGRVPPGLAGIDDAPLDLVVRGDIAAVVGEMRLDRPPGRRADLMAYSRVLDALADSGAVVPVRFGSVLPDAASIVDDVLAPNEAWFVDLLEQLTGRRQFTVRAAYHDQVALVEIVRADPRVAELRQRTRDLAGDAGYADRVLLGELVARAMEAKVEVDAGILLDAIVPFTAAHRVTLGSGADDVATITVLVDDDRRGEFEQQLEDLAEAVHERIRLQLVGPTAPYDFVGDA
jgi:hypothetical protein